jgi:hypothetical protein
MFIIVYYSNVCGEILRDFSGIREIVRMFSLKLMEISFSIYEFSTLRTVFIQRITFVNRGMVYFHSSIVIFSVLANHLNNTITIKWDMCITL